MCWLERTNEKLQQNIGLKVNVKLQYVGLKVNVKIVICWLESANFSVNGGWTWVWQ